MIVIHNTKIKSSCCFISDILISQWTVDLSHVSIIHEYNFVPYLTFNAHQSLSIMEVFLCKAMYFQIKMYFRIVYFGPYLIIPQ